MNKYFLIIASLLVISGCEKSTNSVVCDKYTVEFQESGDELWNKGHDWTLFLNDDTPILCK